MGKKNGLKIYIAPQDAAIFMCDYTMIVNFIQARENVPYDLVSKLFESMMNKRGFKQGVLQQEVDEGVTKAMANFKKFEGYIFKWKSREFNGVTVSYDQTKVVYEIIYAYFLFQQDYPKTSNTEAIRFIYEAFDEHFRHQLGDDDVKTITNRKQLAFCAIIADAIGYRLKLKRELKIEDYFQAARNAVKGYKKQKALETESLSS